MTREEQNLALRRLALAEASEALDALGGSVAASDAHQAANLNAPAYHGARR